MWRPYRNQAKATILSMQDLIARSRPMNAPVPESFLSGGGGAAFAASTTLRPWRL
jgi:hypothetical protein